jgi:hypothetical protein
VKARIVQQGSVTYSTHSTFIYQQEFLGKVMQEDEILPIHRKFFEK